MPTTTTAAAATITVAIDAAGEFADGIAASSANYHFVSTVTTDTETVTTIEGIVDQGSIAATISAGTQQVSYVRTKEGEWIKEADGEWVEAEGEPPVSPPLGGLVDAVELAVVSDETDGLVISGRLGPAAGSAAGLPFTTSLVDGLVSVISYEAETGGSLAMVTTVLSEIGTAGLVTAPET
jgi:hypothetical protein